ncbi:MAG: hypothetical protein K2M17_02225 [Bacilli bacterium]|nr:hypothetical protein [Bacilli bacterium]
MKMLKKFINSVSGTILHLGKRIENNATEKSIKKAKVMMSITSFILGLSVFGAAVAFFTGAIGNNSATADIVAKTGTTDSLVFKPGKKININADEVNFGLGTGNIKGNTTASAILTANNTSNKAKEKYNIFFMINENNFVYTTSNQKPEILLRVTDPSGKEVTAIDGLKRVDGGFDITTRVGGFLIFADYEIETTSTTTHNWKLEVELVNFESDQAINAGKSLNAGFYITTEQMPSYDIPNVNSIEVTPSTNSIDATINSSAGGSPISKYYFAISEGGPAESPSDLNYIERTESNFKYINLKPSTEYTIYAYVVDENGVQSSIYSTTATTEDYISPSIKNVNCTSELNSISVSVTAEPGTNEIIRYYYSIDDGAYVIKSVPTHTFTDLADTRSYKIKVKTEDSAGHFSSEYEKTISTQTYENPSVKTVTTSSTYDSITLTASAEKGTNEVTTYYFKKSNEFYWTQLTTNSYTFTGLSEGTNYSFDIKVSDTLGRESTIYTVSNVSTQAYTLPTVTATATVTSASIEVTATGTGGTGTIAKYMYKRSGQSNWTTVNSTAGTNTYTFNGLTPGASYEILIKVVDSNGRESTEYTLNKTTSKGSFSNNTTADVSTSYDGYAKSISVSLSPTPTTIYYSTSTPLTTSNYSSAGTTTKPTRTNAGNNTVYWCATKSGYNTYCSSNTVTIYSINATLTVTTQNVTLDSVDSDYIYYSYNGDGDVKCGHSSGDNNVASCSVNTANQTVTFTKLNSGTEVFAIWATGGTNYNETSDKFVVVSVAEEEQQTLAERIKSSFVRDGVNGLYYHDYDNTNSYTNSDLEIGDNSYRYAGANPNNYVCFGTYQKPCPDDNLYRIIAVNEDNTIKLIKDTAADETWLGNDGDAVSSRYNYTYYWNRNGTQYNEWANSQLNTVNLNTNFTSNLGSWERNFIVRTTWQVNGTSLLLGAQKNAYRTYRAEIEDSSLTYRSKIGLMYLHDYYFAADPSYWNIEGDNYDQAKYDNWMYSGENEWTITPNTNNNYYVFKIHSAGYVNGYGDMYEDDAAVRPVFTLYNDIIYVSGRGTKTAPYMIDYPT